jgi:hypothetical protein
MLGGQWRARDPMIFGFNTDIAVEGTVYHVQTEVREQEPRIESQIFVRGRCIGKRAAVPPSDATEEGIQELARAQHRWIVEAVRGGFVDDVVNHETDEELTVEFLGSQRVSNENVILRFRVLSGGCVAAQAEVAANWKIESASGVLESAYSNGEGVAEMCLALADGTAELEVKVRLQCRETTRRFLIKSART